MDASDLTTVLKNWKTDCTEGRTAIADALIPDLPKYVLQIGSCVVTYTLHPSALPYANLRFSALRDALKEEYELNFKIPENLEAMQALRGIRLPQTPDDFGQLLLSLADPHLAFENGLLYMPDKRAVNIRSVLLTREKVNVDVVGPTKAGEQLIYELVPLLWALAGVRKPWSEVSQFHQIADYETSTKVRLPEKGLGLLSPNLLGSLGRWCEQGGLALEMGRRDHLHDWCVPSDSRVVYSLDELHILFHRSEPTGNLVTTKLRVGVDARHERNTGVVTVASSLPWNEHLDLVDELVNIPGSSCKDKLGPLG